MIDNLKKNIKNRAWWIALISALITLFKVWGIDLTDYIGKDWQNTIYALCTVALLLGISIDTTQPTISQPQPVVNNTDVNEKEDTNKVVKEEIPEVPLVSVSSVNPSVKLQQIQETLTQLQNIINK